jgi:carbamoylphosphate synthase small subunit
MHKPFSSFTSALHSTLRGRPVPKEQIQHQQQQHPEQYQQKAAVDENKLQSLEYESYESKKLDLQLLLLDNYDSYTYNVYSYLCTMCKHPPIVVSNDAYESWEELIQSLDVDIDGIVISPGPGRPERKEDMGVCLEVSSLIFSHI